MQVVLIDAPGARGKLTMFNIGAEDGVPPIITVRFARLTTPLHRYKNGEEPCTDEPAKIIEVPFIFVGIVDGYPTYRERLSGI